MSEVKSLEGWSATVDHQLACLVDFNEMRRHERNQLAESIGKNRAEVDRRADYLDGEIQRLRKLVHVLTTSVIVALVVLALAIGGLALVVLT